MEAQTAAKSQSERLRYRNAIRLALLEVEEHPDLLQRALAAFWLLTENSLGNEDNREEEFGVRLKAVNERVARSLGTC